MKTNTDNEESSSRAHWMRRDIRLCMQERWGGGVGVPSTIIKYKNNTSHSTFNKYVPVQ